ncbi:GreA/GreB family elongation factor [Pseudoalteromonas sp. SR44-5]|uniref:GreA/GreB family elongation factor n=1 Tax=Pseudoalteromonas rhizosphaerae TaxID=2518973 RepID=A0ABW8KYL8_9GAMM|nr:MULTISPECIES: GreA/GreB family elongation factor [Pseudoalteromonas]MBB1333607.1 GreA/GreB family elongation factor [Pseudoalteromonas sp. SR41-6]MBB1341057.1 GreA/GreB family elongation factor [Pseudoalteromonas sp. SR45-6]MBB1365461.1 GreA/GreB family elongation factor [Pseudoalteromonas sp. SR44-5]MBB1420832.1 GreA/GreB family elongation factor [Pseudoalteromonas sp. SG43-7]MBB1432993.1 GreA/GreB family elongation factor [Pseudoalteromonas sp. SG43-6]
MNKTHVIECLRFALEAQLTTAQAAAKTAHDTATHEENIAENKYDTLGLEAAYLAQGQAQRVNDCHLSIIEFEKAFKIAVSSKVTIGSLVCICDEDENLKWYFLGPLSGGLSIKIKDTTVYVLTPLSPLGQLLMDKQQGDEFSFTIANKSTLLEIVSIS